MRARPVAFAALLTLAGGVPVVSADAATAAGSVLVKAINRAGSTAGVSANAISLSSGKVYNIDAGTPAKLPAGKYVVGSYISEFPKLTVAARTVQVGGATTVTFDARKSVRVSFDVGDSKVSPVDLAVVPFAKVGKKEKSFIRNNTGEWPAANTYVLPDSKAAVRLGIHGVLGKSSASGPVRYDLAQSFQGMPSDVSISTSKAKLARVNLNVATLDDDQSSVLELTAKKKDLTPVTGVRVGAPVLGRQVSYRSPGLQWGSALSLNSLASSAFLSEEKKAKKLLYAAGKTYREEWGVGVWAPRPTSPAIYSQDGQLRIAGGPPICAFSGAGTSVVAPDGGCQLQPQSFSYTLTKGKKSLGKGETVTAAIDASKPAWYTATMTASRDGKGDMASKVTAKWYFQAGGTYRTETAKLITVHQRQVAPGYIRIVAGGADARNKVAGGSKTTVSMTVQKFGKVAGMTLKYSTDEGKTWKTAKVTRKGSAYVAVVPAPKVGSGDFAGVSLKVSAKGKTGATVEQTVINAYGVR